MRRQKSSRIGVHIANAVVWGPVYRTRLSVRCRTRERASSRSRSPSRGTTRRARPRGTRAGAARGTRRKSRRRRAPSDRRSAYPPATRGSI
eukprot:31455-Pelagococcus_subviridis.AAC.4